MHRISLIASLLFLAACASETAELPPAPLPAAPQPSQASLRDGLAVQYYYSSFDHVRDLEGTMDYKDGKAGAALESLSHRMDDGSVLTSGSSDFVGAHITGYLLLAEAGTYQFQVTNNDGVRVHLGGARIHDDPGTGPARTSAPISVGVTQPGWYEIEIWYFEKRGTATLEILWNSPSDGGFVEIPAAVMRHS